MRIIFLIFVLGGSTYMLFQIYGAFSAYKLLGWLMAFLGLVILNEIGRRTKFGGILIFVAIPLALTVYFIAIYAAAAKGAEWALTNPTYVHMNSWFHYAKLYAADCGCIGFMMLKYKWGIGAKEWFKPFPFIIAYDIWNFEYTYLNLPTHSWYCGLALLLAPTFAAAVWNKGGWIQNSANTLAIWCMFAQVFPLFQETFKDGRQWFSWATLPVLYPEDVSTIEKLYAAGGQAAIDGVVGTTVDPSVVAANPTMMMVISTLALIVNIVALCYIISVSKKRHINPYKEDVFVNQKYYKDAMARADVD